MSMTVEQKEKELAKLAPEVFKTQVSMGNQWIPYDDNEYNVLGQGQAFKILLEFPEVMARVQRYVSGEIAIIDSRDFDLPVTQQNLLDELLRLKGVNIDE